MDGTPPPVPGTDRRSGGPRHLRPGREARGVLLRRHLRHQHRVRLRLPAGQHGPVQGRHGPARPPLRHHRRGGLDPHRRGPDTADHLRPGRRVGPALLPVRRDRPHPAGRGGLRGRRGEAHRRPHRGRHRKGRAPTRCVEPVRRGGGQLRAPPHPGAPGQGAVPAGQGLPGGPRRGPDRRRVHRPDPRRPTLVRRPAPGRRGQGAGEDQRGEPHLGHGDPPELLPHVREARRHDRHGRDRGLGVRQHLRAPRRPDPAEPPAHPRRPARPHLQVGGGQVRRGGRGHRRTQRHRAAGAGGHGVGVEVGAPVAPARQAGNPPRGAERQAALPGGRDRRPGRPGRWRHRGHQHGRARRRHHPRRQPRGPGRPGGQGPWHRPRDRGGRGRAGPARAGVRRPVQGRGRGGPGQGRSLRAGQRAPREPAHRQPAAWSLRPTG